MSRLARIVAVAELVLILALVVDGVTETTTCLGDFQTAGQRCWSIAALPELVAAALLVPALILWWRRGSRLGLLVLDGLVILGGVRAIGGDPLALVAIVTALVGFVAVLRARRLPPPAADEGNVHDEQAAATP